VVIFSGGKESLITSLNFSFTDVGGKNGKELNREEEAEFGYTKIGINFGV
jgi:hypothetical protein